MRIVGSLTTLPSRLLDTIEPIKHILRQTKPLDLLYLNIPMTTRKGLTYNIPDDFEDNFAGYKTKLVINRCKTDYGPITKLAPALELETDPDTYIMTFDDDIIYHKNLVKILASKVKTKPNTCFSVSGACIGGFPFYFEMIQENDEDCLVDLIMGVHSVIYRRSMFTTVDELVTFGDNFADIKKYLVTNDDHRISGYLSSRDIPRIVIGYSTRRLAYMYKSLQSDSLCGRGFSMFIEHFQIISKFLQEGLYVHHVSNPTHSFSLTIYTITALLVVTFYILRRFNAYVASVFCVFTIACVVSSARQTFTIKPYTPANILRSVSRK